MKNLLLTLVILASFATFGQEAETPSEYGNFSVSLTVKDIAASYEFYQKLGFVHIEGVGAVDQNWMVLQKDGVNIGLFQGMFPKNVITFNPLDVRTVHTTLTEAGIKPVSSSGLEKEEGPCFFILEDPDGNPIYFDQHQ